MTGDEAAIIDPAFLARLRSLFVRIRRRRRMRRLGPQSTPSSGHTREFRDHRHYTPGDDHRSVDWKLYARLDRLFIRVFEEIQEYHVHICIDRSRSMAAPHREKRRDLLRIAVGLAYLGLANQHRVSVHSFGNASQGAAGQSVRRELPPMKGQGHIHRLVDHVLAMPFNGAGDLARDLSVLRPGDRRGVVFVLSDFYAADPTRIAEWLAPLRTWPSETHVIRVFHPQECDPGERGEVLLEDVESGEQRRLHLSSDDQERYRTAYQAFATGIESTCASAQIGHAAWSTALPFEEQFLALLARGGALGAG